MLYSNAVSMPSVGDDCKRRSERQFDQKGYPRAGVPDSFAIVPKYPLADAHQQFVGNRVGSLGGLCHRNSVFLVRR